MTQQKPKSNAPLPPVTPPLQSSSTLTSSPPLSPSSSFPAASDDEFPSDLSESWLEVEERSSVGPSVLGDVVFSDTSSEGHGVEHETRSQSSASSDGGRDADIEDAHAVLVESAHEDDSNSPSLTGYTDAEASTSKLDSSMDTLHMSSDQIQLIFPDGASFTTSSSGTLSAGFTPSASIAGLTPMPQPDQAPRPRAGTTIEPTSSPVIAIGKLSPRRRSSPVRRGVEASWLQSNKLWSPRKENLDNPSEDQHEYQLLQSADDIKKAEEEAELAETIDDLQIPRLDVGVKSSGEQASIVKAEKTFHEDENVIGKERFPVVGTVTGVKENDMEQMEQHIFATDDGEAFRTIVKKWSTRVSYLALASFISIAIIRTYGSNLFVPFVPDNVEKASNVLPIVIPTETLRSSSFWDHIPFVYPLSTSTVSPAGIPSAGSIQPDPQLIKQALSTLSPKESVLSSTSKPIGRKNAPIVESKSTGSRSHHTCCSLSVRNNNVALTVPPPAIPDSKVSMARKITQKFLRANKTATDSNPIIVSQALAANCSCGVSTLVHSELLQSLAQTFGPIIFALEQDLTMLLTNAANFVYSGYNASNMAVRQAAKGAVVLEHSLNNALRSFQDRIINLYSRTSSTKEDSFARASAILDSISEYVETRLDALSESIEEQTEALQEQSLDSIYKAKSGLDRLIRDYKRIRGIEEDLTISSTNVGQDGPLPFSHMETKHKSKAAKDGSKKKRRGDGRKEKRKQKRLEAKELRKQKLKIDKLPKSIPPMEKSSKGKKFMDMLHHGALALVV